MGKKIILALMLVFLVGCKLIPSKEPPKLSELQIEACKKADEAKTCSTRLAEIGIVLKEDCCKALRKCC